MLQLQDYKGNGGEGGIQLLALITKDLHVIPLKTRRTELLELLPFTSELLPMPVLRIHRYTCASGLLGGASRYLGPPPRSQFVNRVRLSADS